MAFDPGGPPPMPMPAPAQPSPGSEAPTSSEPTGLYVDIFHENGSHRSVVFTKLEVTVGRDKTNDLVLADEGVSRRHAQLSVGDNGQCTVVDLGSTNGTIVNDEPIGRATATLDESDLVALGPFGVRVRYVAPTTSTTPEPSGAPIASAPPAASGPPMASGSPTASHQPPPPRQVAPSSPDPSQPPAASHPPTHPPSHPPAHPPVHSPAPPPRRSSNPPPMPPGAIAPPVGGHKLPPPPPRSAPPRLPPKAPPKTRPIDEGNDDEMPTHAHVTDPTTEAATREAAEMVSDAARARWEAGQTSYDEAGSQASPAPMAPEDSGAVALPAEPPQEPVAAEHVAPEHAPPAAAEPPAWEPSEPLAAEPAAPEPAAVSPAPATKTEPDDDELELAEPEIRGSDAGESSDEASDDTSDEASDDTSGEASGEANLDTLTSADVCNAAMASLLRDVLDAGLGVLVTGDDSSTEPVVRALAASVGNDDHLVWLMESSEDKALGDATTMILGVGEERVGTLEALASLEGDRVVTPPLCGSDLLALLKATAEGCDGLLMAAAGHSVEAALTRLSASVIAERTGFDLDSASAWIASAFPVALEMGCHRDGTRRMMRIAELSVETPGAALDLWQYDEEEGFAESAPSPAIRDWLKARGYVSG